MSRPIVYLAGPITGKSFGEATGWREWAAGGLHRYGIGSTDPLRGKDYLRGEEKLDLAYPKTMSTPQGIFARDLYDVRRADAVLANVLGATKPSTGTIAEVVLAGWLRVPVVLVRDDADVHHTHPFIDQSCPYIVDNLDEGISILVHLLRPYAEGV